MQSQWNSDDARKQGDDPIAQRAYTHGLLKNSAADLSLLTTVKTASTDVFGDKQSLLWVSHGNDPIAFDADRLKKLGSLDSLTPDAHAEQLRLSAVKPLKQTPDIGIIAHATIPAQFVDQTRSPHTLALANHVNAAAIVSEQFDSRAALAANASAHAIVEALNASDSATLEGLFVPNIGLLTFGDDPQQCYERTVRLNNEARDYFESTGAETGSETTTQIDLATLAELRQSASQDAGQARIAIHDGSAAALAFASNSDSPNERVTAENAGLVSVGPSKSAAQDAALRTRHVCQAAHLASANGGLTPVEESDPVHCPPPSGLLQGKIALVSGSAAGIGLATATTLAEAGACVIGADINPEIEGIMEAIGAIGIAIDLTQEDQITAMVERIVRSFGGLDIIVSNAGIFTAGAYLEDMESKNWERSLAVNLTSHQVLLKHAIPFVKKGIDPTIIFIGSRNVNAPGAGAASYSCAKAALNQLCRVAALELAPDGVRVNIIHPDAVFDTKLWTQEALERSAERYGLTVEQYKKRNLMKTEITSRSVGNTVVALASNAFAKTTGAQIPVDGGNDRII